MGADRAAWIAALKAENAALRKRHFNQGLFDLVKCFDTVQHHKLVRAAYRHGYPMHVLRLSLRAYRIQRTIGVGGVYSVMIVAVRSITAGSGTACDELRALLITVIDDLAKYNPYIDLVFIVYVDDITIMYQQIFIGSWAH